MPDPWLLLQGIAVAAGLAAAVLLALAWPWRAPSPAALAVGAAVGVGGGFLLGVLRIGVWPHWPPREDIDRFLLLLLPIVVVVEIIAAVPPLPRYAPWILRALVAIGATPLLLYDTIYLADVAGPDSREWSATQTAIILPSLALGLAAVWTVLLLLAKRPAARTLPIGLAVVCAGSALAVMLSGYATGGQLGLPLAAALAGVGFASLALRGPVDISAGLGPGVVGLFALLAIGRFFGTMSTTHALLLFTTPLLCGLPELLPSPQIRPWMRSVLQAIVVAIPVIFVVTQAQQKFIADSKTPASPGELSLQDYMDLEK
jgi:hypothetical protein